MGNEKLEKTNLSLEAALQTLRALLSESGETDVKASNLQRAIDQVELYRGALVDAQAQLAEVRNQAEQARAAKSDFMSRMSHEIRTPINAILGMTHIAMGSKDEQRIQECLAVIDNSGKKLLGIVNDVLDISKIESHTIELKCEPFSFEAMLMKVAGSVASSTEQKRQKLYCNIDVNMPTRFLGDEARLAQVISNLLSNAVKFTPEGGSISLMAKQILREGDQSTIELAVADSGIGIAKADQARLFQAFSQTDGGKSRQFDGTGLGLAISKQLVELMGGEIGVKSEVNRGSTFRFTAKLTALDEGHVEKANKKPGVHGMNVLIVDPDEDTQHYFCQIMDSFKVNSVPARTIEEAMHLVERGRKTGEPISILFMDWSLAEKDGVNMAQTLKRQYSVSTVAMLPITQLSEGNIIDTHEESSLRYIAKPLFPSALLRSIYEISGSPIQRELQPGAQRYSFVGYHVLLVEDVDINRRIFDQIMQDTQVAISHAENGAIAVELFQQNPSKYDIILMDIHMPVMDGYEATRMIRNTPVPEGKTVPIVAVTANAFAADIEKSKQCGMNGHLTKPIEVEKMFELMNELLKPNEKLNQAGERPEDEDAARRAEQAVAAAEARLRANQYIDYDGALQKVRGSMRVLKILLSSFVSNPQWEQLKAEVQSADYDSAARTVHAIKSACQNLSLNPLHEKIEELEMQIQSRFHIEESIEEVEQLFEATTAGVKDALDAMLQIAKD